MSSSTGDKRARLKQAQHSIRIVERFCYRMVADAETDQEQQKARAELRLAVGLRRMLDKEE